MKSRDASTRVFNGVRVRVIPLKRAESVLPIVRDLQRILDNTRRVMYTIESEGVQNS